MNTEANAMSEKFHGAHTTGTPAVFTEGRLLYWSVRRELWENRSIYLAPLAVAGLAVFGFVIASFGRAFSVHDLAARRVVLEEPNTFAVLLIMATTFVVAVIYSLDALHGERRDRSILFWKSLPVSDLTTVLSKASIPMVVIPLLTFGITIAMQTIMVLLGSAAMLGSGMSPAALWAQISPYQMSLLLYHLVAVHGLYYAPVFAWLLLVSAWARRAPFLWAGLPLLAIVVFEKIAFNTTHFAAMLGGRIAGGGNAPPYPISSSFTMHHEMTLPMLGGFLFSPGMWIGLAFAALFLAAAVRMRRYQGPI
jgi:ABC-2 type transport system permease protein